MLEIFENYSVANPDSKIKPIETKLTPNKLLEILEKYLKEKEYYEILVDTNYYEIYAKKSGFEISFQLIFNASTTLINASVFSKKRRGKTRKYLKQLLFDIQRIVK